MVRNLKTLGLVLAAVFAFSAMAATGAMAQETEGHITSSTGEHFTITGTENAGGTNAFTGAFGTVIKCPGSTYTGHAVLTQHQTETDPTLKHGFLDNGATKVTVAPDYKNCEDQNKNKINVAMNGCDYDLTDATTTDGVGTWGVKVSVTCPAGKRIEVTGGTCKVSVGSQGHLTGLHLTNQTGGHIRLSGSVTLSATVCGFPGSATQHQDVTVTAHDTGGNPVSLSLSD